MIRKALDEAQITTDGRATPQRRTRTPSRRSEVESCGRKRTGTRRTMRSGPWAGSSLPESRQGVALDQEQRRGVRRGPVVLPARVAQRARRARVTLYGERRRKPSCNGKRGEQGHACIFGTLIALAAMRSTHQSLCVRDLRCGGRIMAVMLRCCSRNRATTERIEEAQSVTGQCHLRPQQPQQREPGNPGTQAAAAKARHGHTLLPREDGVLMQIKWGAGFPRRPRA
jgi:hypothetical protein